jgi:hypothetical protein
MTAPHRGGAALVALLRLADDELASLTVREHALRARLALADETRAILTKHGSPQAAALALGVHIDPLRAVGELLGVKEVRGKIGRPVKPHRAARKRVPVRFRKWPASPEDNATHVYDGSGGDTCSSCGSAFEYGSLVHKSDAGWTHATPTLAVSGCPPVSAEPSSS